MYTKFLAASPRGRNGGGKGPALLVLVLLLVGVGWLLWREGYFGGTRTTLTTSTLTNTVVVRTPTNQPPVRSLVSTALVSRSALTTTATNGPPAAVLETQIALDRIGISSGSIDGVAGSQTRAAVRAFRAREGLPPTGELDSVTRAKLVLAAPSLASYRVESADLARLLPMSATWLGKSEQARLDFESLLELVSEKTHAHPNLIRWLNAAVDWNAVQPGAEIIVPSVERERPSARAAFIQIRLADRTLEAFDANNKLLAHFPCSIAQRMEKRPVGELHVAVVAPNPNYTFDPEVFPESAEARQLARKLILPPGPNNPVGAVWIGLDRPGYGIHGTPKPEDVGRTESHGCFRLANWNVEHLLQLVAVGTVVKVEP